MTYTDCVVKDRWYDAPVGSPETAVHEAVELAKRFIDLTWRAKASLEAVGEDFDLSMPQLEIIHVLCQSGTLPMRQLASLLHCEPSNVTGLVDRLEARNLVERQLDPSDRRVRLLALTDKGQALLADAWERLAQRAGLTDLSAGERAQVGELITELTERWGRPTQE
jgi:DNA-binding MarR family transcriptional regulator